MSAYTGKQVAVLGLGLSGLSASKFLLKRNAQVIGLDRDPQKITQSLEAPLKDNCKFSICSDQSRDALNTIDFVVLSPGISGNHPICLKAKQKNIPLIGEVELACREFRGSAIGITGTNGKTTVTSLVTHILNTAGIKAEAVGNIGRPITEAVDHSPSSIFVIELSSFQLESLQTPILDQACILNITPDHLDRYSDMEAYAKAKIGIKNCLKAKSQLWIEENCYKNWNSLLNGQKAKIFGFLSGSDLLNDGNHLLIAEKVEYILPLEYRNRRNHDIANLMAAFALTLPYGVCVEDFENAVRSFCRPPHRIQFVRTINGVDYFDDSKGTNIDAVIKAVETMQSAVFLIAGGVDKGASYMQWVESFAGKVKRIYAIGEAAEKMSTEIGDKIPVIICETLEEAVTEANQASSSGDSVLLSPGCASYDMFRDYAHRGDEYQRIVNKLPNSCELGKKVSHAAHSPVSCLEE